MFTYRYFALALLLCFSASSWAQKGLETEAVSIFKNQTAFFVKEGQVKTKKGKWELVGDTIPQALNGTLWFSAPSLQIVRSFQQEKEVEGLVSNYSSMFLANDGKNVRLLLSGDTTWTEGKIKVLQVPNPDPSKPNIKTGALFAIQMKTGRSLILKQAQIESLRKFEILDSPNFTNSSIQRLPVLQADFGGTANSSQKLQMMYLRQNLSWKPDYLVELLNDKEARISLRTTVVNEAEDVKTKSLNLVAGVPNFKYANRISDLLSFGYVQPVQPQRYVHTLSNAMVENVASYDVMPTIASAPGNGGNGMPGPAPAVGESVEDLFYYTLKDVEIKKGERALLDVFSDKVPVEHIYESIIGANSYSYSTAYSFEKQTIPVLHTIKLENKTDYVWTAAPVMVVQNKDNKILPISQDVLYYTSKQDEVSVKLTEAPDVALKFSEKEIKRTNNTKQIRETNTNRIRYYDLVTVEAEIEIQNFKGKDIRLDIKRAIYGELMESSEKWLKSPRLQPRSSYTTYNPYTDVCWEMKIKKGEQKKITYTYKVYLSHY